MKEGEVGDRPIVISPLESGGSPMLPNPKLRTETANWLMRVDMQKGKPKRGTECLNDNFVFNQWKNCIFARKYLVQ